GDGELLALRAPRAAPPDGDRGLVVGIRGDRRPRRSSAGGRPARPLSRRGDRSSGWRPSRHPVSTARLARPRRLREGYRPGAGEAGSAAGAGRRAMRGDDTNAVTAAGALP